MKRVLLLFAFAACAGSADDVSNGSGTGEGAAAGSATLTKRSTAQQIGAGGANTIGPGGGLFFVTNNAPLSGTGTVSSPETLNFVTTSLRNNAGSLDLNINNGTTQTCGAGTVVNSMTSVGIQSCVGAVTLGFTTGTGTINRITKWSTTTGNLVDSSLLDTGGSVTEDGSGSVTRFDLKNTGTGGREWLIDSNATAGGSPNTLSIFDNTGGTYRLKIGATSMVLNNASTDTITLHGITTDDNTIRVILGSGAAQYVMGNGSTKDWAFYESGSDIRLFEYTTTYIAGGGNDRAIWSAGGKLTIPNAGNLSVPLELDGAGSETDLKLVNSAVGGHSFLVGSTSGGYIQIYDLTASGFAMTTSNAATEISGAVTLDNNNNTLSGGGTNQYIITDGDDITFYGNTNANATGLINWSGYLRGSTQFRDLKIGDGKGIQVCKFTGSTHTLDCTAITVGGTSVSTTSGGVTNYIPYYSSSTSFAPSQMSMAGGFGPLILGGDSSVGYARALYCSIDSATGGHEFCFGARNGGRYDISDETAARVDLDIDSAGNTTLNYGGIGTTEVGGAATFDSTVTVSGGNPAANASLMLVNLTRTGRTSNGQAIEGISQGSFDATAADRESDGVYAVATATRSAGSFNVINVGLHATASGGQVNRAIQTDSGDVFLNNSSGVMSAGIGPDGNVQLKVNTNGSRIYAIYATNTPSSGTGSMAGITGIAQGTLNTSGGQIITYGVQGIAQSTRALGTNPVVNVGLYGNATSGQTNQALVTDNGDVILNNVSGNFFTLRNSNLGNDNTDSTIIWGGNAGNYALRIQYDASHYLDFVPEGTSGDSLIHASTGAIYFQSYGGSSFSYVAQSGAIYVNTPVGATFTAANSSNLHIGDSTSTASGVGASIQFDGSYTGTTETFGGLLKLSKSNSIDGQYDFDMMLSGRRHGSADVTEGLRVTHAGTVDAANGVHALGGIYEGNNLRNNADSFAMTRVMHNMSPMSDAVGDNSPGACTFGSPWHVCNYGGNVYTYTQTYLQGPRGLYEYVGQLSASASGGADYRVDLKMAQHGMGDVRNLPFTHSVYLKLASGTQSQVVFIELSRNNFATDVVTQYCNINSTTWTRCSIAETFSNTDASGGQGNDDIDLIIAGLTSTIGTLYIADDQLEPGLGDTAYVRNDGTYSPEYGSFAFHSFSGGTVVVMTNQANFAANNYTMTFVNDGAGGGSTTGPPTTPTIHYSATTTWSQACALGSIATYFTCTGSTGGTVTSAVTSNTTYTFTGGEDSTESWGRRFAVGGTNDDPIVGANTYDPVLATRVGLWVKNYSPIGGISAPSWSLGGGGGFPGYLLGSNLSPGNNDVPIPQPGYALAVHGSIYQDDPNGGNTFGASSFTGAVSVSGNTTISGGQFNFNNGVAVSYAGASNNNTGILNYDTTTGIETLAANYTGGGCVANQLNFSLSNCGTAFPIMQLRPDTGLKIDTGATPPAQFHIQANSVGMLSLLDYAVDNVQIGFDTAWTGAETAYSTSVAKFAKNAGTITLNGATGCTVGSSCPPGVIWTADLGTKAMTFSGAASVTGDTTLSARINVKHATATVSADQTAWSVGAVNFIEVTSTSSANRIIKGIDATGAVEGTKLTVACNTGAGNALFFNNEDAAATTTNRMTLQSGQQQEVLCASGAASISFIYNGTRWIQTGISTLYHSSIYDNGTLQVLSTSTLSSTSIANLTATMPFGKAGAISYAFSNNSGYLDYDSTNHNTVLAANFTTGTSHVLLTTSNSGTAATIADFGPNTVSMGPSSAFSIASTQVATFQTSSNYIEIKSSGGGELHLCDSSCTTYWKVGRENVSTGTLQFGTNATMPIFEMSPNAPANSADINSSGRFVVNNGLVFDDVTNSNTTAVVNAVGYSNGTTQNRSVEFDDGKGNAVVTVDGPNRQVKFNRHIATVGTAITTGDLSGCGTTPSVATGSTDMGGQITEGTTATGCTITFKNTYTNAPFCVCSARTSGGLAVLIDCSGSTATQMIAVNASASNDKFTYVCVGQSGGT